VFVAANPKKFLLDLLRKALWNYVLDFARFALRNTKFLILFADRKHRFCWIRLCFGRTNAHKRQHALKKEKKKKRKKKKKKKKK
jgi:hypothetical protein